MPARRSPVDYVEDQNGCWIWQLARNSTGYGLKWDRRRRRLALAHRWHYEEVNGRIPAGLQIDHLCRVRACVNPAHLEAVTPQRNVERVRYPNGRPLRMAEPPSTRKVDTADCILWQGALDRYGYGKKSVDGRTVGAHRWAYERWYGPIPKGLHIDHLCRNRACLNPTHLEAVTLRENNRRSKWRDACKNGHVYTPESTLWLSDGTRRCLHCRRATDARYRRRRREER